MRKIITVDRFNTAEELMDRLKHQIALAKVEPSVVYIENSPNHTTLGRMKLIEETLTDGSKVYNIELS